MTSVQKYVRLKPMPGLTTNPVNEKVTSGEIWEPFNLVE
jgi:hypothetical protein